MRRDYGVQSAVPGLACLRLVCCGMAWLLLSAAPAPTPLTITEVLRAQYAAWTPVAADTTPLALLRTLALDWDAASAQLAPLLDDTHAYAELRGVSRLPDGRQSVGVLRAAIYLSSAQGGTLVLNDDWCAAGLCKARTRFVRLRPGQADLPLAEARVVPRILDRDLLTGLLPDCLKGVTLGVQYLPSRYDTGLTAMATVSPQVRAGCEQAGTQLALVTRPLRLNWNAATEKFVRAW